MFDFLTCALGISPFFLMRKLKLDTPVDSEDGLRNVSAVLRIKVHMASVLFILNF